MNSLITALAITAFAQTGTIKGQTILAGVSNYYGYEVRISLRPVTPQPGHMGSFLMRFIKKVPLDPKGHFKTSLDTGTYELEVFKTSSRMPVLPPAHLTVTITAGKASAARISNLAKR